jgi:phosphate transport system substrate-binding protein
MMKMMQKITFAAALMLTLAACGQPAPPKGSSGSGAGASASAVADDVIRIVGSSTVYPFTSKVAERFGAAGTFKTPVVEATGTGGGMKVFCEGVGPTTVDVTNASRQIKKSEYDSCVANGVTSIVELKIGFDGIVIANAKSGPVLALKPEDIWKALAKEVMVNGQLVANPNTTWKQVNPALPDVKIQVYGPPPTSGTRDSWNEQAMEGGAKLIPEIKALDDGTPEGKKKFEAVARTIREDGVWINMGENDNAIVQTLEKTPNAYGVFGYSFLEENLDQLQGATIAGIGPTAAAITSGQYPISRSMFVYVKAQHVGVTPGLKEFLQEFASDRATGTEGYLAEIGLVPLLKPDHDKNKGIVEALTAMIAPTK